MAMRPGQGAFDKLFEEYYKKMGEDAEDAFAYAKAAWHDDEPFDAVTTVEQDGKRETVRITIYPKGRKKP